MGCIGSRLTLLRSRDLGRRRNSNSSPNVFAVLNVDDMSRHISPGKLEVTETDLVLHLRGKPPLTWPLRCLRRYGYEEDLFSFESGRRCPTGAGIYAFKCNRAQSLFNLLQSKIQGTNPLNVPVPTTPITPNATNANNVSPTFDYVNITENSLTRLSTDDLDNARSSHSAIGFSSAFSQRLAQSELDESNQPLYMNVDGRNANKSHNQNFSDASNHTVPYFPGVHKPLQHQWTGSKNVGNFSSDKIFSQGGISSSAAAPNSSVVYTNVDCSANTVKKAPEINYAELDLQSEQVKSHLNSVSATKNKHLTFITGTHSSNEMKSESASKLFDSVNGSSSGVRSNHQNASSTNDNSNRNHSGLGYATIDFDRTAALSIVTRSKIKLDFSCSNVETEVPVSNSKKNRHNSTAL